MLTKFLNAWSEAMAAVFKGTAKPRCSVCGRALYGRKSIERGAGPVCAKTLNQTAELEREGQMTLPIFTADLADVAAGAERLPKKFFPDPT